MTLGQGGELPPEVFVPDELQYVLLLFVLFVLPRALQRFRLPSAVTCLALGAAASIGFGLFENDAAISLMSTLGIVSLFLFAGLDVEFGELQRNASILTQHIAIRIALIAGVAFAVQVTLNLGIRASIMVSLALTTPSTGFILDSLDSLGVNQNERAWIKSKAIATELVALLVLVIALLPPTPKDILGSILVLSAMVAFLPLVFRVFAKVVLPYAPKSEFGFLLMAAVLCALITRKLGAYYLVGAFVVGLMAQRFREQVPAIASEKMLSAVELFATFFVPFYFFHAGLQLNSSDFSRQSVAIGAIMFALLVPLRILLVAAHRRVSLGESFIGGARIGLSITPTLVFTLVIAEILRDRFAISQALFGGLVIYTIANTLLPGFILRIAPPGPTEVDVPMPEMTLGDPVMEVSGSLDFAPDSPPRT